MQKTTIIKSNEKTLWLNLQTLVKFYNLHLQSKLDEKKLCIVIFYLDAEKSLSNERKVFNSPKPA